MAGTDPRVYEGLNPYELPPNTVAQTAQEVRVPAQAPLSDAAFPGPAARGDAFSSTANLAGEAPVLASIGAAISQWDTIKVVKAALKPDFAPDGSDAYEALQQLPFTLTHAEEELWRGTKSAAERAWYQTEWEADRAAARVAGQHVFASMAASIVDPAYLVTGLGFGAASRVFKGAVAARTFGAVTQGASAAGIAGLADTVTPVSSAEFTLNVLANAAGGTVVSHEGKLVPKHPDYPAAQISQSLDQFYTSFVGPAPFGVEEVTKQSFRSVTRDGKTVIVQQPDTTFRRVVEGPLAPGAPAAERSVLVQAVDAELEHHAKSWAQRTGEKIQWSMHKTVRGDGSSPARVKAADWLFDDNADLAKVSVEAEHRAVHADLVNFQHAYEADLRAVLAQEGHGWWQMLKAGSAAKVAQAQLEDAVYRELLRRSHLHRQGKVIDNVGVPEKVKKLADKVQLNTGRALDELTGTKLEGTEALKADPGYIPRVWDQAKIDALTSKFMATGLTKEAAHTQVVKLVQQSLRRANPTMDADDAYHVASSIINRTLRKGYGEDSAFKSAFGKGTKEQVRDELKSLGVPHDRVDRVMKILGTEVDEAGKASFLKHRVDLDYTVTARVGDAEVSVVDLLDTKVATLLNQYNLRVAGRVALSRKGVQNTSDLQKIRAELAHGTSDAERKQVLATFDGGINHIMGLPTGQDMNPILRNLQAYNRMITLGASGLWQITEYATAMAKYGIGQTVKAASQELPLFRKLLDSGVKDKLTSRDLKDVLTNLAEQNIRIRPYIGRFEDNFDLPLHDRHAVVLQQGAQMVPWINGMKYIHSHQARTVANLIVNNMRKAAEGSAEHRKMLEKYGAPSQVWDNLRKSVDKAGLSVDGWDDGVWETMRPVFAKMMDEAVLHQRLGDTPAFAKLDNVGKFIFTYRSFIITAHNKLLSGTLSRDGVLATSALLAYQFPLAVLATQANSVLNGKGALDQEELYLKAIGQMGSLGLLSEVYGWVSGNKREFGSPGLIPVDRGIRALGSTSSAVFGDGSASKAAHDWAAMSPLIMVAPGIKGLEKLAE